MRIGIVGGGMTGLALGDRLADLGHQVSVFERERQLGGLATHQDYGAFFWDRFYHVILPSDRHLLGFLKDIGLGEDLRWNRSLTGYFERDSFYSVSSSLDFLRFPPVTLWGKLRLVLTILYCSRLEDWRQLENTTVEDWLVKTCGRNTFERMWKPLLLAKLGESYRRVSAVFIWSYIKRMFSARDASVQSKELLGYVTGGYRAVFARLEERILAAEGSIHAGSTVTRIEGEPSGGVWVEHDAGREHFDKLVFTSPVNVLRQVAAGDLLDISNADQSVEYLGVICMVLTSRKPLTPYYVVNIADRQIPFTGVIGMTNIVSREETAGLHLTYLPKYVLSDDPLLRAPDEELREPFMAGLRRMFPDLDSAGIVDTHLNRAFKVQPLQVLGYSNLAPRVTTRHPDFFVLNSSQFVNGTLNNNSVIEAVDRFVEEHARHFPVATRERVELRRAGAVPG